MRDWATLIRGGIFCALAITLGGIAPIPGAAQGPRRSMPVDEAASRPDFFTFRAHLQAAIAQRDAAALLGAVHPDIKISFGGDDGIEAFKQFWRIQESDSRLWRELAMVLSMGGSFNGTDTFTAPYVFSRWPPDTDAFENVAVIGANVRIRTAPRIDAPTLTSVSFSILHLDAEALRSDRTNSEWTAVVVNGRKGYIATRFIRSPIDYRAMFTYAAGRWLLTLFVAGD